MRRVIIAVIVSTAIVAFGAVLVTTRSAQGVINPVTAYDADINHDGKVNFPDLLALAYYYGQVVPLPTPTPIPVGGGGDYVIARDVILQSQMGATTFYAADPSVCPGSILYLATRSLVAYQVGAALTVFGNGSSVNVDPGGDYYVFQQLGGPNTRIDVTPLGSNISIAVTLELHCRPTLP